MAQLIQVIKKFDDGTETIHDFIPNPNVAEIETKVAEAQHEGVVTASESASEVGEATASEAPKRRKKKVVVEEEVEEVKVRDEE